MTRTATERLADIKALHTFQTLSPAEQHARLVDEAKHVLAMRQRDLRMAEVCADAAERRGDADAPLQRATVPYSAGFVLEAQTVLDTLLAQKET